jgi:WD repeat-containing protein 44
MVTAVGLSKDGRRTVVGTMRGKCRFYGATSGAALDYEAQLDVKNKRGQHARGKKVTGVTFAPKYTPTSTITSGNLPSGGTGTSSRGLPPLSAHAGGPGAAPASSAPGRSRSPTRNTQTSQSLLVTSNDSRIRLYDGYVLRAKFKGHANRSTQIKASFSPRGDYIICGSDDGWVYIWTTRRTAVPGSPERGLQAGGGGRETHAFDGAASRGTDANGNAVNSGIYSNKTNTNNNTVHSSQSDTPRSPLVADTGSARSSSSAAGTGVPVSQPVAKEKNSSFECFQVASDVVTVALFAPECAQRALESLSPTSDAAAAAGGGGNDVGGRLLGHGGLRGQVILTAGYNGEIKIYENIGLPHWL